MKFILIMVYVLSQTTTTIVVEFDTKQACEQAGKVIREQMYTREVAYPDVYLCAAKE